MTQAQVTEILNNLADRGRESTEYDVMVYLQAKEIISQNGENQEHAREVVEAFSRFVLTGEKPNSFAEFLLPCPMIDEESGCRNEGDRPVLSQMPNVSKVLEPSGI
jgi:hypothetical protein